MTDYIQTRDSDHLPWTAAEEQSLLSGDSGSSPQSSHFLDSNSTAFGPGVISANASVVSSSLRKSSKKDIEDEVLSRTLEPSDERHKKANIRRATASMTKNKLQISALGLVGRDMERNTLSKCLDRVTGGTTGTSQGASNRDILHHYFLRIANPL